MTQNRLLIALAIGAAFASAHAQSFEDFTPTSTTFSGWNTDRANPSTFAITGAPDGSGNALDLGVSGDANSNQYFYAYEGMQKTANIASDNWEVSGSLYVTADMLANTSGDYYNTGLWSRDNNPDENSAWYGILEFRNTSTTPGGGFYYWDGNAGTWDAISMSLTAGSWYNLTLQQVGTTMNYLINGNVVATYAGASQAGSTGLQSVFLEDYNFGQSSDVYWQNVGAAPTPAPEPAAMAAMWGSAAPFVIGAIRRRRAARS